MEPKPVRCGVKRKRPGPSGQQQRLAAQREETTQDSAVHALLMLLIAKGIMSGVLAHQIAVACKKDFELCKRGYNFPDLDRLANLKEGRNLIRSVHATLEKSTTLPAPMKASVPYTDGLAEGHFLLPHEYFSAMFEDPELWAKTILPQEDQLEKFWDSFQEHPLMHQHPIKRRKDWKRTVVPLSLHGDEVPVVGVGKIWSRSVLSFSWMSMVANAMGAKGQDISFYIFGLFEKFACESSATCLGTMETVFEILFWSFDCLWKGVWPSHDHRGIPWPRDSWQFHRAGRPLAGKFCAILLQLCGDLDYNAKWLGTPVSTNHSRPCIQCRASFTGPCTWHDNRAGSPWQQNLLNRGNWRAHWTTKCKLFMLPGMSCWSIALDLMHNLYLGWLQHFFGSTFYLLTHECMDGSPLENLRRIDAIIKTIQRNDQTRGKYRQRLSKLSMFMKRSGFPKLKGRAAEIRGIDFALLGVWRQFMDNSIEQHIQVEAFLQLIVEINELMNVYSPRNGMMAIPEPHYTHLFEKGCQAAQLHVLLMEHYAAAGVRVFNCTSKMHFTLHTLHLSKWVRPSLTWCYKGESNMRCVQQLWRSCLSGNKHFAVGRVAATKQRHLVALKSGR
eukprot:Skav200440  [mRNA]  locus=scaffold559:16017:17858:- [translate_table: standard]